MKNKRTESVP